MGHGSAFTIAASPRQRSHSQVQVPRLRPHFAVSDSRLPKEQGGPVMTPGTGFSFRRLLRLAGLRWRYSTPPPHVMVVMKTSNFIDITPCSPVKVYQRYEGTCHLHLQVLRMRQARNQHEADSKQSLPEDGGCVFLRNVAVHFQLTVQGYIAEDHSLNMVE
jgi:hypothetical protein